MERSPGTINSIDSLRRRLPSIVKSVNADPALARRAAANPLLALDELGYSLTPSLRQQAEDRVRFSVAEAAELGALRSEIAGHLKGKVGLDSAKSIKRALGTIGVRVPIGKAIALQAVATPDATPRKGAKAQPVVTLAPADPGPDDPRRLLDALRQVTGEHPVVAPLVRYVELDTSRPRLAGPETYKRLRSTDPDAGASSVSIRFTLASERDAG